ncbi:MAG: Gfo/Idh/MocA family oxidoreductase [Desulfuromonadales bacterium]|jgi:predicted dehydrogenase
MSGDLRAAVIGVGYLGRWHAEKFAAMEGVELLGVVDIDPERAAEVSAQVGAPAFADHRQIIDRVDLVSIAVPTGQHFTVARDFLAAGRHVLLEKPMTRTLAEADALIELATAKQVVLQVGHLERFNQAVLALQGVVREPRIVFSHRLAPYRARGADVSVVLDLMIHDIDIVLQTVGSTIEAVESVGCVGPSGRTDIANARLRFANGCVANITASRVSDETMRKFRVYGDDIVASVDCQARRIALCGCVADSGHDDRLGSLEQTFAPGDPLLDEIASFVAAVREGRPPLVSGDDGRRALEVALRIESCLGSGRGREGLNA